MYSLLKNIIVFKEIKFNFFYLSVIKIISNYVSFYIIYFLLYIIFIEIIFYITNELFQKIVLNDSFCIDLFLYLIYYNSIFDYL